MTSKERPPVTVQRSVKKRSSKAAADNSASTKSKTSGSSGKGGAKSPAKVSTRSRSKESTVTERTAAKQSTVKRGRSGVRSKKPLTIVTPTERERMIAEAAYYLAEQRGFVQGTELDDWLNAESAVEALLRGD